MTGTNIKRGLAYDAVALLGFGDASPEPLPVAESGEVIIRYGGWSLRELRDSDVGKIRMHDQKWYERHDWSVETLPAGLYCLRLPVPDSFSKTFGQQEKMLSEGETVAPVVLVATALLSHYLQTGEDLLNTDFARCREHVGNNRAVIDWEDNLLNVGIHSDDDRDYHVWLSSVRTF